MKKPLVFRRAVRINAPAAKVWAALTTPALTRRYMFGAEAVSDWKVGSPLIWRFEQEGKQKVFKGNIVASEQGKLLSYTIIDPEAGYPDIPANYTTVTYELAEDGGVTTLMVSDGNFATVADGEKRYKRTISGWDTALKALKSVVEEMEKGIAGL
jgi:uncharacterized protein YndB with AHSA1/START domain